MIALGRRARPARMALAILLAAALALTVTGSMTRHGTTAAIWHPPVRKLTNGTSLTWAGYDAHTATYTQVSASWREPTVTCGAGETSYSSFWAGLDGGKAGDDTVEQTGTDADCNGGTPTYYAWYEMYPKFARTLRAPVKAGDSLSASVTVSGTNLFQLTITDRTEGWTSSASQRLMRATRQTAEVIAEAPSSRSGVLPLADFGTAYFSASLVDGAQLGKANPEAIVMVSSSTVKAQPSALSGGENFSVSWKHS